MAWRRLRTAVVLAVSMCAVSAAHQGALAPEFLTCGQDESLPAAIQISWATVVLAGDGRLYSPCPAGIHGGDHREIREKVLIDAARSSGDIELRWRAAQAQARNSAGPAMFTLPARFQARDLMLAQVSGLGGLVDAAVVFPACDGTAPVFDGPSGPRRWQPGRLFFTLLEVSSGRVRDASGTVRDDLTVVHRVAMEGAYAIGALLSRPGLDPNVITAATKDLRTCLNRTGSGQLASLVLEDIGLAHYEGEATTDAENFLVQESQRSAWKTFGAVKGLEALLRQHPEHKIGEPARFRLRQLLTYENPIGVPSVPDAVVRIRRLALMALQAAHVIDATTLEAEVNDPDWQIRRLVAGSLNLADPRMAALARILSDDPAPQVRYELVLSVSRQAVQTHVCAPLVERFGDPSPIVAMRAIDLLPASCTDIEAAIQPLINLSDRLANAPDDSNWHIEARALSALARIKPAEARPRLAAVARSPTWQVRAAVATAGGTLRDEALTLLLTGDREPNVRTAVIDALVRMGSAAAVPEAIGALNDESDYQLVRTAAIALHGLPNDAKEAASNALLTAMERLTGQASDTSRDPRLAILERLEETLEPGRAPQLVPFMTGFDDKVNAAAIRAYIKLLGQQPPSAAPKRRYPYQPSPEALNALPAEAVIQLEDGVVTLRLLKDVAPVTIARFAELARRGYYNGLTFHRVVPNFVVQGGSPGANEYMGTSRFMRDEVGPQAAHMRGAVGMSTRGGDTGDGQFFIDLVDLPRFDRDYTVFAYVTQGMELVDKLLEGAKIAKVSVR